MSSGLETRLKSTFFVSLSVSYGVKLPAHRAALPGKEIIICIVPLDPTYKVGLAGHLPVNPVVAKTGLGKLLSKASDGGRIDPFDGIKRRLSGRGRKPPLRVNPEQAPAFMPVSRRVDILREWKHVTKSELRQGPGIP